MCSGFLLVRLIPCFLALVGFLSPSCAGSDSDYASGGYIAREPHVHSNITKPRSIAANAAASPAAGDAKCLEFMCVSAVVANSNVTYVMQSLGTVTMGWMSIGFGLRMAKTPMVVMWRNNDGSVTLSQRITTREALPTADPKPPRTATVESDLTSASGNTPKLSFSIPADANTNSALIFALGVDTPTSSNASTATFREHIAFGSFSLDLTKTSIDLSILQSPVLLKNSSSRTSASARPSATSSLSSSSGDPSSSTAPVPANPVVIVALLHGIFCTIAFLVIMPAGALLARLYRTFSPSWFRGHWALQFIYATPFVIIGAILAISTGAAGGPVTLNTHGQLGVVLFILYFLQVSLGGIIHFIKPKKMKGRPPQNYAHAVIGLTIIVLSFYQVRTGYKREWPNVTGRTASKAIDVLWYLWGSIVLLAYALGLILLKKQYAQERAPKQRPVSWVPVTVESIIRSKRMALSQEPEKSSSRQNPEKTVSWLEEPGKRPSWHREKEEEQLAPQF